MKSENMQIIKKFLQKLISIFFKIYFSIFGAPRISSPMNKTLALYKSGDFSETFQLIRIWDAPYEVIDKYIPNKGVIIDLGSGDGLLANYIGTSRPKTQVVGIDINPDRVMDAQKNVKNVKFILGDVTKKQIPQADVILIIHVLHHLSSKAAQEKLLNDCSKKLKKNGKIVIAEVSQDPLLKYIFSWITDHIIVPILFEGKVYNPDVFFRSNSEWRKLFKELGFKSTQVSAHKSKPFSHVVFTASKNATARA